MFIWFWNVACAPHAPAPGPEGAPVCRGLAMTSIDWLVWKACCKAPSGLQKQSCRSAGLVFCARRIFFQANPSARVTRSPDGVVVVAGPGSSARVCGKRSARAVRAPEPACPIAARRVGPITSRSKASTVAGGKLSMGSELGTSPA